jgi:hypothetical protein
MLCIWYLWVDLTSIITILDRYEYRKGLCVMRLAIVLFASLVALPASAQVTGRWATDQTACQSKNQSDNGVMTVEYSKITQGEWSCKLNPGGMREKRKWVVRGKCHGEHSETPNEPLAQIELEEVGGVLHLKVYEHEGNIDEYLAINCDRTTFDR